MGHQEMDSNIQYIEDLIKEDYGSDINEQSRERITHLLKSLEDQKKVISDLRLQNQQYAKSKIAQNEVFNKNKEGKENDEKGMALKGTEEIGILTDDNCVAKEDFSDLVDKYDKVAYEYQITKTTLEKEVIELQNVVNDLSQLIEKLKNDNNNMKSGISYMEEIQYNMKREIENLQLKEEGYLISINNFTKEVEEMFNELREKKKKIAELEDLNKNLQNEYERIEEQMEESESHQIISKQLTEQNLELSKKVERLEELEIQRDVVVDKNVKTLIDSKSKRLEKLENELSKLLKDSKTQAKEIIEWKEKYDSLKENYDELIEKLSESHKLTAGLKNMIASMKGPSKLPIKNDKTTEARNTVKPKPKPEAIKESTVVSKPLAVQKPSVDSKKKPVNTKVITKSELSKAKLVEELKKAKALKAEQKEAQEVSSLPNPQNSKNINEAESQQKPPVLLAEKIEETDKVVINVNPKTPNEPSENTKLEYMNELQPSATELYNEYNEEEEENVEESTDRNTAKNDEIDQAIFDFLRHDESNSMTNMKVTLNRSTQTDYFSIVNWILENEDEIRENETDFEKIKDAVDILADMIGFNGVEDYAQLTEPPLESTQHMPSASEKPAKNRTSTYSKSRDKKVVIARKNVKVISSKLASNKLTQKDSNGNESPKNKENLFNNPNFDEDRYNQESKPSYKLPYKKTTTTRVKVDRDEHQQDLSDDQDQLIQKSKLIRNQYNKNETFEVIEYIRVPKELSIVKSAIPDSKPQNLTDQEINEIRRIANTSAIRSANTYENELLEREKLYFRIYINIKQRYQFKPEKFLKIFKLTFNKVPDFAKNYDENYNPKAFLFNFEEFKAYFTQILHSHQYCGRYCVHFDRFYKKMGLLSSQKHFYKMNSQYIDRLPKLLAGGVHDSPVK